MSSQVQLRSMALLGVVAAGVDAELVVVVVVVVVVAARSIDAGDTGMPVVGTGPGEVASRCQAA